MWRLSPITRSIKPSPEPPVWLHTTPILPRASLSSTVASTKTNKTLDLGLAKKRGKIPKQHMGIKHALTRLALSQEELQGRTSIHLDETRDRQAVVSSRLLRSTEAVHRRLGQAEAALAAAAAAAEKEVSAAAGRSLAAEGNVSSLLFSELNVCMDRFWQTAERVRLGLRGEAERCLRAAAAKAAVTGGLDGIADNSAWSLDASTLDAGASHLVHARLLSPARQPRLRFASQPRTDSHDRERGADEEEGWHRQQDEGEQGYRSGTFDGRTIAVALDAAIAALDRKVDALTVRVVQRENRAESRRDCNSGRRAHGNDDPFHSQATDIGVLSSSFSSPYCIDSSSPPTLLPRPMSIAAALHHVEYGHTDAKKSAGDALSFTLQRSGAPFAHQQHRQQPMAEAVLPLCALLRRLERAYGVETVTYGASLETVLSLPTAALPAPCVALCVAYLASGATSNRAFVSEELAALARRQAGSSSSGTAGTTGCSGVSGAAAAGALLWAYECVQSHCVVYLLQQHQQAAQALALSVQQQPLLPQQQALLPCPPPAAATAAVAIRIPLAESRNRSCEGEGSDDDDGAARHFAHNTGHDIANSGNNSDASRTHDTGADAEDAGLSWWWPPAPLGGPDHTIPTPYDEMFPLPTAVSTFTVPTATSETTSPQPPCDRFFTAPARTPQLLAQRYLNEERNPTCRRQNNLQ